MEIFFCVRYDLWLKKELAIWKQQLWRDFLKARDEAKEAFGDLNITNSKTYSKSVLKTALGR